MPTGDTLQVFGLAIGMMACALQTSGWRKVLFWCLAALFAFLTLVYANALPQFGLPLGAINRFVTALLAPLILGGVAFMLREKRPAPRGVDLASLNIPPEDTAPNFAATPDSKWEPNITFLDSMLYLFRDSKWGDGRNRQPEEIRNKLTEALYASRITSWGKAHPVDREFQIRSLFWLEVEITLESNCVFSKTLKASAYDVRLCREELEAMWPPKVDPVPEASA